MASEFNIGMEDAFDSSYDFIGNDGMLTMGTHLIPVIVNQFVRTTEVSETGAAKALMRVSITIKTADYITAGGRKGMTVTLPNGHIGRIESVPYVPSDGRGTIELAINQQ